MYKRTLTPPQPSASVNMNWMSSMTSFTSAQLSQTPSHLTQSSTGASARQLPPLPDWQRNHGITANWPCTRRSRSTEPASWGLSCMAASPGHCVPDRSESSMLFTCAASDAFWTSPGRTRSQTTLSWKELDAPACSRCRNRDVCAGSATLCAWTMDGSPKTSSMENSCRENDPQADHSCDSKMCARGTQKPWTLTRTTGKQQPSDGQPGDRLCRMVSPTSKRRSLSSTGKREWEERLQPMQTGQRQTSSVSSATGTVIPTSDWLATLDAAPEKTPRAQLHSLPRLKNAYIQMYIHASTHLIIVRIYTTVHTCIMHSGIYTTAHTCIDT